MLQRILLPLDGSILSEAALPWAEALARAQGAELVVVRVVEPLTWQLVGGDGYTGGYVTPEMYDELAAAVEEEAREYLARTVERLRAAGLAVTTQQPYGFPAAALLDLEQELRPDLVVMATHGRTGLARFALGSIADRMVREGVVPVLLARSFGPTASVPAEEAPGDGAKAARLETALVPLDGSPLAEEALSMVRALAGKPLHTVRLLRAIAAEDERTAATSYLESVAGGLSALKLETAVTVSVDAPSHAIATAAQQVDLVILSTHGRGGLDRLRHGSVAEQATRELATPTLLIRAGTAPVA